MREPEQRGAVPGLIVYRMEVVGGPFDGAAGMVWRDDGEHAPPELILLGVCPGDGSCNSGEERACASKRKKHTYYWLPSEATRPTRVIPYELSESFIEPEAPQPRVRIYPARAIYVIGGLLLPRDHEIGEGVKVGNELEYADGATPLPGERLPVHAGCPCTVVG